MLSSGRINLERIHSRLDQIKKLDGINKLIDQVNTSSAHELIPLVENEISIQFQKMIAEAKHEVCMQFYKFYGHSHNGKAIISAICKLQKKATETKSAHPITVNILLNSRGKLAQALYKENNDTKLEPLQKILNNEYFHLRIAYHSAIAFGTYHSKMILIDRKQALLCSGDPTDANNADKNQFETATIITGPVVLHMHLNFKRLWQPYQDNLGALSETKASEFDHKDEKSIPSIFMSKKQNGNPLSIKYANCISPYKIAFLEAINLARQSIKIMSPNLNDPDIHRALAKACNNNIEIQIIIGKHHNDAAEKYWGGTNHASMATLIQMVNIHKRKYLNIKWATNANGQIVKHGEPYTMHGKYACVDDRVVFVGSTPLDKQGLYYSREADLVFESPEYAVIFNKKMFAKKHLFGKDYFLDCFDELLQMAKIHIHRLMHTTGKQSILCKSKAIQLNNALKQVLAEINHPDIENCERPRRLLSEMLPLLNIHTISDQKSYRTASYNAVKAVALRFGIYESIGPTTSAAHIHKKLGIELKNVGELKGYKEPQTPPLLDFKHLSTEVFADPKGQQRPPDISNHDSVTCSAKLTHPCN